MADWVRLCAASEAPAEGAVTEVECGGRTVCLARVSGELRAVDNICPHRDGPLGQGWIEGTAVVCPWHSWAFDLTTGEADYPAGERVDVYPLQISEDELQIKL